MTARQKLPMGFITAGSELYSVSSNLEWEKEKDVREDLKWVAKALGFYSA